jgi:Aerotolerance regulator N-terminal/von Willebrand factor type A domain
MGLFSPWFLAGAAAVGLPIYLHLLRRHRAELRPFSSLMFFERRTQSSIKHRRLRYLLLLSLRLALLLLVALAFANPFISRQGASAASDKLLLLAIDNSFSMRAGSRLADARREALSVLASRRRSERAQIMTLGSQVRVLTEPTQDPDALRAAVESVEPGDSRASFGELAHALRSLAESAHTPIELHLFSDMQKSGMPSSFTEMVLPTDVSLVPHAVAGSAVANWTVESVDAPGQVWEPNKAAFHAVVAGYHTPAATRTVSLVVDGKPIATRSVEVPAGGRAAVEFLSLDVPYGFSRCEVRIDSADSLPADDVSLFTVERSDPERVLFVHESSDSRSPIYFRDALAAAAEKAFNLEAVTVDQLASIQPSAYAFVVLSDVPSLPASFEDGLMKYVRSGGSVLIAVGTSAARQRHVDVFGENIVDSYYYSRDGARFLTVGDADPSHPSIGKAERWSGVRFYFAVRVNAANSRVVARLTDQTPLLLEKKVGEGRVLLLGSGLDNLTNDFPIHPVFIPFIEQTARYLSGTERRSGARVVDSFLELRSGNQQGVGVEVIDPAGQRALSLNEAAYAETFQLRREGFYELHLANGRRDVVGVNADRRESDLDVMPDDVLALWRGNANVGIQQAAAGGHTREPAKPYGLWWYIMLLVLAAAVAESWLAGQYLGRPREEL